MPVKVSEQPFPHPLDEEPKSMQETDLTTRSQQRKNVEATWRLLQLDSRPLAKIDKRFESSKQKKYDPNQVAVVVDIGLERRKDANNVKRVRLAHKCKDVINSVLTHYFESQQSSSSAQLILNARVVLASEGSAKGRVLAGEIGIGHAKLSVVWCVQIAETSRVIEAHRDVQTDSLGCGCADLSGKSAGHDAVLRMADKIANDIIITVVDNLCN